MRAETTQLLECISRTPPAHGQLNPRYARWCRKHALVRPKDFLDLSGEVVSGHRDRHVLEVRVDNRKLFLKKEHRIPFWQRVRNWRAGFGPVSLSEREASTLEKLHHAGVPVPQWIAAGSSRGRAFLLMRQVRGTDLRSVLRPGTSLFCRWKLAKSIGAAIARLHQAGFDAPDLSAKHVLVKRNGSVVLIDWARATHRDTLVQSQCLSALATLHASIAPALATVRERVAVLKSWMNTLGFHGPAAPMAREIIRIAKPLHRRPSIREQLYPARDPRLMWIDDEALCVRKSFWREMAGKVPDTLRHAARDVVSWRTEEHTAVGKLICFPAAPKWRQILSRVTSRPLQSVGIQQAGLAFRLARRGIPMARVLAFGGRPDGGGFLLCRISESMRPARSWLALLRQGRRSMLRRIGQILRRCHEAGCRGVAPESLMVESANRPRLRLVADGQLRKSNELHQRAIVADLRVLTRGLDLANRSDVAQVVRGYFLGCEIDASSLRIAAEILGLSGRRAA